MGKLGRAMVHSSPGYSRMRHTQGQPSTSDSNDRYLNFMSDVSMGRLSRLHVSNHPLQVSGHSLLRGGGDGWERRGAEVDVRSARSTQNAVQQCGSVMVWIDPPPAIMKFTTQKHKAHPCASPQLRFCSPSPPSPPPPPPPFSSLVSLPPHHIHLDFLSALSIYAP